MTRDEIIGQLRALQPELARLGVSGVSLFGSRARARAHQDSDIDVAFVVSQGIEFTPLDLAEVGELITERLGHEVDAIREPVRNAQLQNNIDRDRVRAF